MFAFENIHGAGNVAGHVNIVVVFEQPAQSVARMFFVINDKDDGLDRIHECFPQWRVRHLFSLNHAISQSGRYC